MTEEGPRIVNFGAKGYGDFTTWPDNIANKKRQLYIQRHSGMGEDWSKEGLLTAGFWSRWLLWERRDINDALANIRKRFDI